jgi:hypothetical protein
MAITVNPYADRAAAQMAVQQQSQPSVVQQPYNLFAQQKQAGYPGVNTPQAGPQMAGDAGTVHTTPITQPAQIVQNTGGGQRKTTPITSMEDLARAMGYTSPQEEERLRKASVANQRILAIGDALRHIGNIANTVNYAPSQQFTNPVVEEEQRYQKGKALRDAANLKYYTYQQAKAAQEQKARQWEQQFQLNAANAASQAEYRQEQARIAAERAANQKAYQEGNLARQTKADEARNRYNEARLKQDKWYKGASLGIQNRRLADQQRRTTAYVNRQSSGGGSGVAPLDTPKGRITPNGRSYSNQLLQMFDYAKSKGYVKETDVAKRLREMGFGKDQSDNVKRQMVMDLLRTNQDMGDYASSRLGWSYGAGGGSMDLGLEDEEDDMDLGLE